MEAATLSVSDVTVRYGRRVALQSVSWNVGHGLHMMLGPNGAGKSSLMGVMSTLLRSFDGEVTIAGIRMTQRIRAGELTEIRRRIGYVPQDNLPRSRYSVRDYLSYISWLKLVPHSEVPGVVGRAAERAAVSERLDDRIGSLSGGMRRRVGVASALIGEPDYVFLDEPSAGLDPEHRARLRTILTGLAHDATVVCSTHDLDDLLPEAATVTILNAGRIHYQGTVEDFEGAPGGSGGRTAEHRYMEMLASDG